MTLRPRHMPSDPQLFETRVLRTQRLSRSFQRVTLAGGNLGGFDYAGFDHWFRLFIPHSPGAGVELPGVTGNSWWKTYRVLDEAVRPHCSNYTVAELRVTSAGVELDIDVVLHWDASGELTAPVARWSVTAETGSPVAILDQGLIFDPDLAADSIVLACDETGLPAVRGILHRLDAAANGVAIIEVPTADDIVELTAPTGMRIDWIVRQDDHAVPGSSALDAVRALSSLSPDSYAYVVGESTLATEGRRALHRAGIPKSQITFSGYWKHSPELALAR